MLAACLDLLTMEPVAKVMLTELHQEQDTAHSTTEPKAKVTAVVMPGPNYFN